MVPAVAAWTQMPEDMRLARFLPVFRRIDELVRVSGEGETVMIRTVVVLALGLMLGGCLANPPSDVVLPQRSPPPAKSAAQLDAEAQARTAAQDTQCRSYGAKPGSSGYTKCRADLARLDEAARVPPVQPPMATPGATAETPATSMAAAEPNGTRRSRPMLDEDSAEAKFNVCSYGGTITNCY
jgi:hypothetical protein